MAERIAIGSDHAGFELKEAVGGWLRERGFEVVDCGTHGTASVDYPDFAQAVALEVQAGQCRRGVVVCGSGAGACITANKVVGVRAAVCHDTYTAHQCVEHDDVNVLCLGARIVGLSLAEELLDAFLGASFTGEERHQRRLDKVLAIESAQLGGSPAGAAVASNLGAKQ